MFRTLVSLALAHFLRDRASSFFDGERQVLMIAPQVERELTDSRGLTYFELGASLDDLIA